MLGYTGLLSFGHAAFLGTAAAISGLRHEASWGLTRNLWPAARHGRPAAAGLRKSSGRFAIRRQGIYFVR
ncbi:hypothetical protein ACU4GD_18135 [Cupriavidus basilensis]